MNFKRFYKKIDSNYVQIKNIEFPEEFREFSYKGESMLNKGIPKIYLKNERKYLPDFLSGYTSMLVVSQKVKDFLAKSSEKKYLEFLETEIVSKRKINNYFIINILHLVKCMDREKSIYDIPDENPNVIVNLRKMIIDEEQTEGRLLFNVYERPVDIIVEESFAEEMIQNGINDIRLLPMIGSNI